MGKLDMLQSTGSQKSDTTEQLNSTVGDAGHLMTKRVLSLSNIYHSTERTVINDPDF